MALDKATLAHRVLGLAEEWLGRPFAVRDWILRATSRDGVQWHVDPDFRFNPASRVGEAMSYYCARSPDGRLWFRSSVRRPGSSAWQTVLTSGGQTVAVDLARLGALTSPVWVDGRLYCVLQTEQGPAAPACFEAPVVGPESWRSLRLTFRPALECPVEDFHVRRWQSAWYGWVAARDTTGRTSIGQWQSHDGLTWDLVIGDILAGSHPADLVLANNPWAVPPFSDEAPWRLYLRIGEEAAVGNRIVSVASRDAASWVLEPGVRIAPQGAWAAHGVGFPFVEREAADRWTMYFSGFWGASSRGEAAAESWRAANRRAREAASAGASSHV